MTSTATDYQVYLLRIWKETKDQTDAPATIRVSLENTRTGERVGFSNWDKLVSYLKGQFGEIN